MSLECGLRVVAVRWNRFVEDATAVVVQPIRANFLVGAVHKLHSGVDVALHRAQVAFVTARRVGVLVMMVIMTAVVISLATMVTIVLTVTKLFVVRIMTFEMALLKPINLLVDDLVKWVYCVCRTSQGECSQDAQGD